MTVYRTGQHIYFAQDATDPRRLIKIGASNKPPLRVRSLEREIGRPITLLGVIHDGTHRGERGLHRQWDDCRIPAADLPTSEWFAPTPGLLEFIGERAEPYRPAIKGQRVDLSDRWVRPDEAAAMLGWTVQELRTAAKAGRVPFIRLSPSARGHMRFRLTVLNALRTPEPTKAAS